MSNEILKGGAVSPLWHDEIINPIKASIPVVLSIILLLTILFLLALFVKAVREKRKSSFFYLIIIAVIFTSYKQILAIIVDVVGTVYALFGENPFGILMGVISISTFAALIYYVCEDFITWLDKTGKGK